MFEELEGRCSNRKLSIYEGEARVLKLLKAACLLPEHKNALMTATGSQYD